MKWIVQTNFGAESKIELLIEALKRAKADFTPFEYLSHSETLPPLDAFDPGQTFLYGATRIIELASFHPEWKNAIFFDMERFSYSAWAKHYGEWLLNSPSETTLLTMGEFVERESEFLEGPLFFRPIFDLKEFNGSIFEKKDFLSWAQNVVEKDYPTVNAQTQIMVGPPHRIDAEWRLFMGNGKVLTGSQYKKNGRMYMDSFIPGPVLDKAIEIAQTWAPAPLFTLDLAQSGSGLWIVEAQSIQSSGFYAANMDDYVRGIEQFYQDRAVKPKIKI